MKFFKCETCGNIITFLHASGVPVMCCGKPMVEITPNTTDAALEKHVPVASVDGNKVHVQVGSVAHPMSEEHHIAFIILETTNGYQKIELNHNGKPEADFMLSPQEKPIAVYEYCNLHGLWKADL
ncbi:MAG: desulfoferrodoxin family protein [Thomasclavelia sp.]|nr:desulfoferrodoxin family protein [Thomasclavelia sp.]